MTVLSADERKETISVHKEEPPRLRNGKLSHKRILDQRLSEAEGKVMAEFPVMKPSGRAGRIDIHVRADDILAAVVEIKDSDWDAMTMQAVRRNANRYARQVWEYAEAALAAGNQVAPGIEFTKKPLDADRLRLVETVFDKRGIQVVWNDESVEDQKNRKK